MKKFIYKDTMKNARALYKSMGVPLLVFLIAYGFVKEELLTPLMGKLWGLVLSTTPEGFISNSNFKDALLKSPWIIPAALAFILVYAIFSMWQASALLTAVGYAHQGHRMKLKDLISVSFVQLRRSPKNGNWIIPVYALVILPLSNLYETNDTLSYFVVPEYIQDFINNKWSLYIIFIALCVFIIYVSLRWFFLLQAFFIKHKDFRAARAESKALTAGSFIKDGINAVLYNLVELIRLSIIPAILILIPLYICYCATSGMEFSASLYNAFGFSLGYDLVSNITGTLVQISTMCFIVELYNDKLQERGLDDCSALPALKEDSGGKMSINTLQLICSILFSVALSGGYLFTVAYAQHDSEAILAICGRTEIIAHKGYSSEAPENTMAAFELADKCEAVSFIELDVWSTKDGIPVVIHNATIEDATGVDRYVYDCTYEELQQLPATYSMDKDKFSGERIPGLEEVIKTYAGSTPLLIEIKGFKKDSELPAKIVELMKKYGCEDTSYIHSGDYGALKAAKQADPNVKCGLILAMVTGNYYDLPYADFFSVEHSFVNESMVEKIHDRGKEVFAWTVNYSDSADALKFTGVDGVITDFPDEIDMHVSDSNELFDEAVMAGIKAKLNISALGDAFDNYADGEY